jgi:NTE family protein
MGNSKRDALSVAGRSVVLPSPCLLESLDADAAAALIGDAEWFNLPGGQILFESGEPSDALYLLLSGGLAVIAGRAHQGRALLAQIHPGETVGEMGVLSERPRSATVVAIRDSQLLRIGKPGFMRLLQLEPAASLRLLEQLVDRLDKTSQDWRTPFVPRTLALLSITPSVSPEAVAHRLTTAIGANGLAATVLNAAALHMPADYFDNVERANDLTIYAAPADGAWTSLSVRRADQLLLAADASASTPEPLPSLDRPARLPWRICELALVHFDDAPPRSTAQWIGRYDILNRYHIRWSQERDIARLARYVTGRAVALVLSGGGARGFGHVGVLRALREGGIAVDMIGGTSIGAIIGAGAALELSDAEFDLRMRSAFVHSNPLNDYTIPLVALTRGRKVAARLHHHFGDRRIEDLWLPFFCVVSNLTTGRESVLREGVLWEALRTAIAIPGLLPPSIMNDEMLADGALLNNLPAEVMAETARGPIIGVDVTHYRSLPAKRGHYGLLHPGYHGPGIASLLMRAATMSSVAQTRATRTYLDLLLEPPLGAVDVRDWRAYDRAVAAAYQYTVEHLPTITAAMKRAPKGSVTTVEAPRP